MPVMPPGTQPTFSSGTHKNLYDQAQQTSFCSSCHSSFQLRYSSIIRQQCSDTPPLHTASLVLAVLIPLYGTIEVLLLPIADYCVNRHRYEEPALSDHERTKALKDFRLALFTASEGLISCIKAIYKKEK